MSSSKFDGAYYDPEIDEARLITQLERVKKVLLDGRWHTVAAIAETIRAPEPSVSAQIRNLRKEENGGYEIETKRADDGLFIYRMVQGDQ